MKKTLIALCGVLSLAAFAEPAETAPAAAPARPMMRQMPKPTMLMINEKTTAEEIAAFKAEVAKKVDEAVASYAAKTGDDKKPVRLVLFSNEGMGRGQGMGPRGEGRGPRGEGRGPRGDRPRRNRGEGDAQKPAAEAK